MIISPFVYPFVITCKDNGLGGISKNLLSSGNCKPAYPLRAGYLIARAALQIPLNGTHLPIVMGLFEIYASENNNIVLFLSNFIESNISFYLSDGHFEISSPR